MSEHHANIRPRLALLCILALVTSLCACAGKRTESALPRVAGQFTSGDGSPLTDEGLARLAVGADYMLLGERHDNAADHAAQAFFLQTIARSGIRPAVGLEMLPRTGLAKELRQYANGVLPLQELAVALNWSKNWGFDFTLYRPIFETAREYGLPVYGLNIPNAVRTAFSRKGEDGLTKAQKRQLPERIIPPLPEQREMLAEWYKHHSAVIKGMRGSKAGAAASQTIPVAQEEGQAAFERFLRVQSLWDSTMAEEAHRLRIRTGRPVAVIAGGGHVERGWGIAHRLSLLDPGARILLVMPFSGEAPDPSHADIFFYSPIQPRGGYGITLSQERDRIRAARVRPDSPAARAGLKNGDIILAAGDTPLKTPADLHKAALNARNQRQPLPLRVERAGRILILHISGEPI